MTTPVIASVTGGQVLNLNIEVTPSPTLDDSVVGRAVVLYRNYVHSNAYSQYLAVSAIKPLTVELKNGPNLLINQPYTILTIREIVEVYYHCVEKNGVTQVELVFQPYQGEAVPIARLEGLKNGDDFAFSSRIRGIR